MSLTLTSSNIVQDLPTELFGRLNIKPVTIDPIPEEYRGDKIAQSRQATIDLLRTVDFKGFQSCINSQWGAKPMDLGIDDETRRVINERLSKCDNWDSLLHVFAYNIQTILAEKIMRPVYYVLAKQLGANTHTLTLENAEKFCADRDIFGTTSMSYAFNNALGQFFGLIRTLPALFQKHMGKIIKIPSLKELSRNTLDLYREFSRLNIPTLQVLRYTAREDHGLDFPPIYKYDPNYFILNQQNKIKATDKLMQDTVANLQRNPLFKDKEGPSIATGCPFTYVTISDGAKSTSLVDALHKYLCEAFDQILIPYIKPNILKAINSKTQ